jgi:uncharacterized protein DUF6459
MSGTIEVAPSGRGGGGRPEGRAERRRFEPNEAEPERAAPARGEPRRGEPGRAEPARTEPATAIRLRPVPQCEPPYEDEADPRDTVIPGQLALQWPPAVAANGDAIAVRGVVSTFGTSSAASAAARALAHGRPVVAGVSTDAKAAVHRFVRHCVEVLNGYRPAGHLRPLALPAEAATIVAQGTAGARRVASLRKVAPGRRAPRRPSPVAVVSLRLCQPSLASVEAAVALVTAQRTWALALRLELHHETWSATALRLI